MGAVLKNVVPVQNTSVVEEMKRNQVVNVIINYHYLFPGAPNKNIVQNHLNIALLSAF